MTKQKEEIDNRNKLHKANIEGHLRMRLGYRGPRLPEEKEDDEGGSGGLSNGLMQHPLFADLPEGMADENISGNTQVNTQVDEEQKKRELELNPKLQAKLEARHSLRHTPTPRLER